MKGQNPGNAAPSPINGNSHYGSRTRSLSLPVPTRSERNPVGQFAVAISGTRVHTASDPVPINSAPVRCLMTVSREKGGPSRGNTIMSRGKGSMSRDNAALSCEKMTFSRERSIMPIGIMPMSRDVEASSRGEWLSPRGERASPRYPASSSRAEDRSSRNKIVLIAKEKEERMKDEG